VIRDKSLRIEVGEEVILRLLEAGHVCAADFRCLDCESKKCIWRLCLESCAYKLKLNHATETYHRGRCRACGRHLTNRYRKSASVG
jgi:hypothetical protein